MAKGRAPAQLADTIADFDKTYVGPAGILSELRKRAAVEAAKGKPILFGTGAAAFSCRRASRTALGLGRRRCSRDDEDLRPFPETWAGPRHEAALPQRGDDRNAAHNETRSCRPPRTLAVSESLSAAGPILKEGEMFETRVHRGLCTHGCNHPSGC